MYSRDRIEAFKYTLSCLKDMPQYDSIQKILVVDEKTDFCPLDWELVEVPRINNDFCWGRMWDAGVFSSRFENVIYLDSDRLLPKNYISLVLKNIKDYCYLFTSNHFMLLDVLPIEKLKKFLVFKDVDKLLQNDDVLGYLKFDLRHGDPFHGTGKNAMSGSTAFTKKTYIKSGGVDHWYCGHGAFADSDFHIQNAVNNCEFLDLGVIELHYPHQKLDNTEKSLSNKELWLLSLDNFIYYCKKWSLPMSLAEAFAARSGVKNPAAYISIQLKKMN